MIIKIKEIEIQFKWWQVGLIVIAVVMVTIALRENPERAFDFIERTLSKAR